LLAPSIAKLLAKHTKAPMPESKKPPTAIPQPTPFIRQPSCQTRGFRNSGVPRSAPPTTSQRTPMVRAVRSCLRSEMMISSEDLAPAGRSFLNSSHSASWRACSKGPTAASRKSIPQIGRIGPPPTAVGPDPGTAVSLCVGVVVNGIRARPRHKAAPKAARAPSTITATPTIRVNSAECHESVNKYRSGPFHRMVWAANPRTSATHNSKAPLIAPSFGRPADSKLAERRG